MKLINAILIISSISLSSAKAGISVSDADDIIKLTGNSIELIEKIQPYAKRVKNKIKDVCREIKYKIHQRRHKLDDEYYVNPLRQAHYYLQVSAESTEEIDLKHR